MTYRVTVARMLGASLRSAEVPLTPKRVSPSGRVADSPAPSHTLSEHIIIIYYRPYPYHYLPNDMQSCTWPLQPEQQGQQSRSGECSAN